MITKKKGVRKVVASAMAMIMTVCILPGQLMKVGAEPVANITQESYTDMHDGMNELLICEENVADYANVNDVAVPEGCRLIVDMVRLSANGTITVSGGGCINIFGNGSVSGTIAADEGAVMLLDCGANVPEGIELYDSDGVTPFPTEYISWTSFEYTGGKWVVWSNPDEINIGIDGVVTETEGSRHYSKFKVTYAYGTIDNNTVWYNPYATREDLQGCIDENGFVDIRNEEQEWIAYSSFVLENIPGDEENPWDETLTVKIEIVDEPISTNGTSKIIAWACLGGLPDEVFSKHTISEERKVITYNFSGDFYRNPHLMHISLAYPNEGDGAIVDEVNNYLYAYSGSNTEQLKNYLARELYERFIEVAMFEDFGIESVDDLKNRIDIADSEEQINVKNKDGDTESRQRYRCTVDWGYDFGGNPVVSEIPVYGLSNNKEIIVCTDFDEERGTGSKYYVRTVGTDEIDFTTDSQDKGCLILDDSFSNVVAGGNGGRTDIMNTEGIYSFRFASSEAFQDICNYETLVRVMDPNETYAVLHGSGETKNYGELGLDGNGVDQVWKTGDDATAVEFVGNTTVSVESLANIGVNEFEIVNVSLADEKQSDGVVISEVEGGKAEISFKSNFYDSVTIIIEYNGGNKKELTIQRIGLVIGYKYLFHDRNVGEVENNPFEYDYSIGEQILVYATYYHPTNDTTSSGGDDLYLSIKYDDGNSEIIYHEDDNYNFAGYQPETGENVASTTFIIGFAPAKRYQDSMGGWYDDITEQIFLNKYGNRGGFSATVINAGYDNNDSYGGTQIGSSDGVHWNGQIKWFD